MNGNEYEGMNMFNEGCGTFEYYGDRNIVVGQEDLMTIPVCFNSCSCCENECQCPEGWEIVGTECLPECGAYEERVGNSCTPKLFNVTLRVNMRGHDASEGVFTRIIL